MATAVDSESSPAQAPAELRRWVEQVALRTRPERVHWCDGSDAEYRLLVRQMLASKTLLKLNPATHPGCYLHRSDPSDVARVEHLTFVCSESAGGCRPQQFLDGACRGAAQDGCAIRRLHARPHDVRAPLLHGPD